MVRPGICSGLILALLLVLGGAVQAQEAGRLRLDRPGAGELGLRGQGLGAPAPAPAADPEGPAPLLRPASDPAAPLALSAGPLTQSLLMRPAQAADRCRLDCAQTYYFCLAGEEADECAQGWGQCRLGCSR